jgi:hypothetical protein
MVTIGSVKLAWLLAFLCARSVDHHSARVDINLSFSSPHMMQAMLEIILLVLAVAMKKL